MHDTKKMLFLVLCIINSLCDASVLFTSISQDSLTLGDVIELRVSCKVPQSAEVKNPQNFDGFGAPTLVVKNWSKGKATITGADSIWFSYLLTTYDMVQCTIPALPFVVLYQGGSDTLVSQSIPIRVVSVITAKQGDTIHLKDIKPQLRVGTQSFFWLWIIGGLVFILVLYFVIRALRKKRVNTINTIPLLPPYEEAVKALSELEAKKYLRSGMIREYIFELSEIVKRYIERSFQINALELTTEELLEWLEKETLGKHLSGLLRWFFTTTDPVKFAKYVPEPEVVSQMRDRAIEFIEKTKPVALKEQSEQITPVGKT